MVVKLILEKLPAQSRTIFMQTDVKASTIPWWMYSWFCCRSQLIAFQLYNNFQCVLNLEVWISMNFHFLRVSCWQTSFVSWPLAGDQRWQPWAERKGRSLLAMVGQSSSCHSCCLRCAWSQAVQPSEAPKITTNQTTDGVSLVFVFSADSSAPSSNCVVKFKHTPHECVYIYI